MSDATTGGRMNFRITHMIADRTTCSYSPECGGKQTVSEMAATSLEDVVLKLTGKGLYDQGHSLQGGATTVSDPNGGRWDCFKIRELPANETPSALATSAMTHNQQEHGMSEYTVTIAHDGVETNYGFPSITARRAFVALLLHDLGKTIVAYGER